MSEAETTAINEIDGQWFDLSSTLEGWCFERGSHRWGSDKYADESATCHGYHRCLDCARIDFL